ncbi:hypothetical protein RKE25_20050 [Dyella sp. BiH032]|uniref:T4 family baseplate hub assembly chaperone n=1 Tax=Dyella sp. BiH032 TaxID=3075430 RepID=UPI0028935600|nr:hypothetical protein [Dyella sp. BiH032]WNL45677.1 hypothetical protein RKE25_20050 [Dyella sp. BiH032]
MAALSAAQLIAAWEQGGGLSAAARGWLLLGLTDAPPGDPAMLPLGRRDVLLLRLRERLFGSRIDSVSACPACGAAVESSFGSAELLVAEATAEVPDALDYRATAQDVHVRFRLPGSEDLLALERCADLAEARSALLRRCVLSARIDGEDRDPLTLPADVQAGVAAAMAAADPQADVQLLMACPACAHAWSPTFDIAAFLWQELHAWVLRMLRDVDLLARHYHWAEADILAMTPRRRQAYLELCTS